MSDTSGKGPEKPSAAGTGSETPKPASAARPRPPVIDLEAKELGKSGTASAGTSTTPPASTTASSSATAPSTPTKAPEKPEVKPATAPLHPASKTTDDSAKKASTTTPPPPPPPNTGSATKATGKEPSRTPLIAAGLGGAALATVLIFALSAAGLLPNGQEQRVATLEEDIVRLQDALSAQTPQGPDPRIAALERRLTETTDKLDGAISAAAAAGAGGDNAATADLTARLEQAEQGNAALSGRIDELTQQREALETGLRQRMDEVAKASGGQAADAVTARENLALGLSAAAALDAALLRGAPYTGELAAVRAFIPDADVAALTENAEKGLPAAPVIAARWRQAVDAAPPPPPPANAGVVDRFMANAKSLVQVTPIGAPEGTDPGARRARLLNALDRADLTAALTEWNAMDETFKKATSEPAIQAKARVDAEAASAALQTSALGKAREAASAQ